MVDKLFEPHSLKERQKEKAELNLAKSQLKTFFR